MDNKSVILPKWIDKIIFDDFVLEISFKVDGGRLFCKTSTAYAVLFSMSDRSLK